MESPGQPGTGPRDPEQVEAGGVPAAEIAAQTTVGAVHLTVADLARSTDFYKRQVGLELLESGDDQATLGVAGRALLVLIEQRGAPPATGYCGLYHFALLLPERAQLAAWLAHAARDQVALTGLSDHYVSEAIYLNDPDEHGIEIYWDRPRPHWEGQVMERMTTLPLDVKGLFTELEDPASEPFEGLPAGTVMGHVHLRVANVAETVGFYRDALGMGLMAQLGPQAAFFAAGGYHHHFGSNVWESAGRPPAPPGSATLRHATIVLPDTAERDRVIARLEEHGQAIEDGGPDPVVHDPSGNALALTTA